MNIVLVGGGKAAVTLLDFFAAQKDVKVIGVCDIKPDAPGIIRARELKLLTATVAGELVNRPDANMIIELTGNAKVRAGLLEKLRPDQDIMSSNCAKLMCDTIETQTLHDAMVAQAVSEQFAASINRLQGATGNMDEAFRDVEKLLREAGIIALNAKIEAARAGEAGDAFSVVVDSINDMLKKIQDANNKISSASKISHETLAKLQTAKDQLADEFRLR